MIYCLSKEVLHKQRSHTIYHVYTTYMTYSVLLCAYVSIYKNVKYPEFQSAIEFYLVMI